MGLAFYDDDGVDVSGPNSYSEHLEFLPNEKLITVDYTLQKVILNQGSYKITVAVLDETEAKTFDHRIDVCTFRVSTDKQYYGKVIFEGSWAKHPAGVKSS